MIKDLAPELGGPPSFERVSRCEWQKPVSVSYSTRSSWEWRESHTDVGELRRPHVIRADTSRLVVLLAEETRRLSSGKGNQRVVCLETWNRLSKTTTQEKE